MNKRLIEQIKALNGVKTVNYFREQLPNGENMVIVVFEPEKPILHDEYAMPIFKGDPYWWVRDGKYHIVTALNTIDLNRIWADGIHIFASLESAERWIEENKPEQPIYVDPETGDEFFEGDEAYWFSKNTYGIDLYILKNDSCFMEGENTSKLYNTRKKCEIALAKFLANKNGYVLEDRNFKGIKDE